MKKALKWIGIGIGILLVLLLAGLTMLGGVMVKGAINGFGPAVMGVPVTLEKVSFRPLAGRIKLTKLHVGNPKGFKTPALFELGEVDIEIDVMSLLRDTIVIHRMAVVAPHITYERALLDSNFGVMVKQLQGGAEEKNPEENAAAAKPQKNGKKVVIEELIITDPSLNVSVTAAGGHSIPVKLGKVALRDIGKEHGGVTFTDAIKIIFSIITSNVENAVLGAGDLIGTTGKTIGSGTKAVGGAVADGASSVVKGIGGLFGVGKKSAVETSGDRTVTMTDTLDIAEAVFRYQFKRNASGVQQKAPSYFLLLFGKDPDTAFLTRFKDNIPPVKKGSEFKVGEGLQFRVTAIKRITDSTVEVEAGYFEAGLSSAGNTYIVEKKDGTWIVTRSKQNWIS